MFLNDDIVDMEKPDGICLPTFVVDKLSGLFLHPSIFPPCACPFFLFIQSFSPEPLEIF